MVGVMSINIVSSFAAVNIGGSTLGAKKAFDVAPQTHFLNTEGDEWPILLKNITTWLLGLTGSLTLLALVLGGFMYVSSLGDESKTKKAKTIIFWAIIGFCVVVLAYAVITIVTGILAPPA